MMGLGVFFYASGSAIDGMIGPKVNDAVAIPALNATDLSAMASL